MAIDLSGLKDIHLPKEPSWWPPALGWWLVLGGILLGVGIIFGVFYRWYSKPKQYALRALKYYHNTDENVIVLARHISALLKRICLLQFPRKQVAKLTDEEWIDFLIQKTGNTFSEEQLQLLSEATYMPEKSLSEVNVVDLYTATRNAILKLFERKKNGSKSTKSA